MCHIGHYFATKFGGLKHYVRLSFGRFGTMSAGRTSTM